MFQLSFCLLQWFPHIVNVTCDCRLNCLLSLPFFPLNIFFGAGISLQFCLLIDMLCKGPFSGDFQIYRRSTFFSVFLSLSLWGLNFSVCSNFLVNTSCICSVGIKCHSLFLLVSIRDRAIIWANSRGGAGRFLAIFMTYFFRDQNNAIKMT